MNVAEYNKAVEDFADSLFRYALKSTRDDELARDIVQSTFEKLWIKRETVDNNRVKSYLFTATYHSIVDDSRKIKRMRTYEESSRPDYINTPVNHDLKEILDEALNTLPAIQKSVVLLRDYEGYSYEEIGEITDLKESQVKVYIFRARKALKKYIGSMEVVI